MSRRRRLPRHAKSERGLTLPEVLVTTIIMGLVIGPLSMTLIQTMKIIPESGARTRLATDMAALQAKMATDVAQAGWIQLHPTRDPSGNPVPPANDAPVVFNYIPFVAPSAWVSISQQPARILPCITVANTYTALLTVNWDAAPRYKHLGALEVGSQLWTFTQYEAVFTPVGSPTVQHVGVEIRRSIWTWDWSTSPPTVSSPTPERTTAAGSCKPGDTSVVAIAATAPSSTSARETISTKVTLRADSTSDPTTLDLTTIVRTGAT